MLTLKEGSSDIIGYYKVMEYPIEDHTAAIGYDFSDWGIGYLGSYLIQAGMAIIFNVGDWIEIYTEGDAYIFSTPYGQFKANSVFGKWSVIGTINGTSWDTDFIMTELNNYGMYGCWGYDLDYNGWEEFKFRLDGNWDVNLGLDEGGLTDNGDNTYSATMVQGGYNISLPMEGKWNLTINTVENTLTATYNGK